MAGRIEYNNEGTPIAHNNFKGAVDNEMISPDLIGVNLLKDTTNMSPFRKVGSLVQCPGHSDYLFSMDTTTPTYPTVPTNYYLTKQTTFQMDRDNTSINMLVYSNGTQTKVYIDQYYNPSADYGNNNPNKLVGWVKEWLEITEIYPVTLGSLEHGIVIPKGDIGNYATNDAYKGWFIVNPNVSGIKKHSYVVSSVYSSGSHTLRLFAGYPEWDMGDTIYLTRFPVNYLYNFPVKFDGSSYSVMNFTPTQFINRLNELRMPCGKDNRPLLLEMILGKTFFKSLGIDSGGILSAVTLTTGGYGYEEKPAITVTGGGTGGEVDCWMGITSITYSDGSPTESILYYESDTALDSIRISPFRCIWDGSNWTIDDPGKYTAPLGDYTTNDIIVSVWDTGGTDESPVKVLTNWGISELYITNPGFGYTSAGLTIDTSGTVGGDASGTLTVQQTALDDFNLNYDGLWFDFAQPIQKLYKSQVSSFINANLGEVVTTGTVKYWSRVNEWTTTEPAEPRLRFELKRATALRVCILKNPVVSTNSWFWGYSGGEEILYIYTGWNSSAQTVYESMVDRDFPFSDIGLSWHDNGTVTPDDVTAHRTTFSRVDGALLTEADNIIASNPFIGIELEVDPLPKQGIKEGEQSWQDIIKSAFILTAIVDRNEVIVAHGFVRPGQDESTFETNRGMWLRCNPWFSRRIKGFNLYIQKAQVIAQAEASTGKELFLSKMTALSGRYPYFQYISDVSANNSGVYMNELPLLTSYSIEDFMLQVDNSIDVPIGMNRNKVDDNTFSIDFINGCYSVKMYDDKDSAVTGITRGMQLPSAPLWGGGGLKFIVSTNRYIDQDTTMNFTKGAFIGQTNGRYFIIGCKNVVEPPLFENGDTIIPNIYGAGVSQYDTFVRDNGILAGIGDKDIIRNLYAYRGYMTVVKDDNVFGLDVRTDNEIEYRVVDTMVGRGSIYADAICETPYGIGIPSTDGVWLSTLEGVSPLMGVNNCRLSLYRELMAGTISSISSIYYNKYNEMMIFISSYTEKYGSITSVFVYSFEYKFWTNYEYPTLTLGTSIGTGKDVLMLLSNGTSRRLVKINESSASFVGAAGTPTAIITKMWTHNMPYGGRFKNITLPWLSLHTDYTKNINTQLGSLSIAFYKEGETTTTIGLNLYSKVYLKSTGLFAISTPGTNYITIDYTSSVLADLSVLATTGDSYITMTGNNAYELGIKAGSTINSIVTLINSALGDAYAVATNGTQTMSGQATAQLASLCKYTYNDCVLDFMPTLGTPGRTLSVLITQSGFSKFNINGLYTWVQTQNRVPKT